MTLANSRSATSAGVRGGVTGRAGDLRCAAQRVGVLDARAVGGAVAGDDCRVGEQPGHVRRGDGLAGVWAQLLQVGGEDAVGGQLALDAHRGRDVGEPQQVVEVGQREDQLTEHAVGAVDEGEALLLGQRDGGQAVLGEGLRGRLDHLAGSGPHVPLADHRQCHVRQRGQITGAAEAAVLVHHRRQPGRDQVRVGLRGVTANPGAPAGQGRESQQHHRADDLALDLGA